MMGTQETFAAACAEIGIQGVDVEAELKALSSRLPHVSNMFCADFETSLVYDLVTQVFQEAESLLQVKDIGTAVCLLVFSNYCFLWHGLRCGWCADNIL